jgi:probable HAF family extracellular repeat protein
MNKTAVSLAIMLSASLTGLVSAQQYTVTVLLPPKSASGASPPYDTATGINNSAEVSGSYSFGSGNTPVTWKAGVASLLPLPLGLGGAEGVAAFGINNNGLVVGTQSEGSDHETAVYWLPDGSEQALPDLGTGQYSAESSAFAANDAGVIVGQSGDNNGDTHAVLWTGNATVTDLGTLDRSPIGLSSYANAVNNSNEVVGYSDLTGGTVWHATLWTGNSISDLGTLGGNYSTATAINNSGQIVGWAQGPGSLYQHAALWAAGSTKAGDLGTLGGTNSQANAINSSGQIVGYSGTTVTNENIQHATLWINGSSIDLNTAIPSSWSSHLTLSNAVGINDSGAIIALGTDTELTNSAFAYLLTPKSSGSSSGGGASSSSSSGGSAPATSGGGGGGFDYLTLTALLAAFGFRRRTGAA